MSGRFGVGAYRLAMVEQFADDAPRLGGELVILEPLTFSHEERLFEVAGDSRIWRWQPYDPSGGREAFHAWLAEAVAASEAGREMAFAILDGGTGTPIGSTRYLDLRPEHRVLEIGWTWLAPRAWRTGANIETKLLLLGHAFEKLGCVRVEFRCDARNERSRAALSALPAQFEGVLRKQRTWEGSPRDIAHYSIIDDEWASTRKKLLERLGRDG